MTTVRRSEPIKDSANGQTDLNVILPALAFWPSFLGSFSKGWISLERILFVKKHKCIHKYKFKHLIFEQASHEGVYWVSQVSQIIFWTGNQKQTIRSVQGLQHSITRKTKNLNVLTAVYRSRNVQVCQQACRKGIILIKLSPPPIIGQPGGKSFPFSASVDTEQAVCKKLFADSWLWALAGVLESLYCEDYN